MVDDRLTPCIDAETLAAWAAGALNDADVRLVESHLAVCERCQAVAAALARAEHADSTASAVIPSAPAPASATPSAVVPSRWAAIAAGIMLTGGIAGLVWWQSRPPSPVATATLASSADDRGTRDVAPPPVATPAPKPPTEAPRPAAPASRRPASASTPPAQVPPPTGIAAPAPPPPPPPPPAPQAQAGTQASATRAAADTRSAWQIVPMTSRGNTTTWRVSTTVPGQIERSTNSGETWTPVPLDASVALAGAKILDVSAPSASVCWMVGEKGLVVLVTDNLNMRRVPFPEPVTLVRVLAENATTARVITADGRAFATTDAGLTWQPARF